MPQIQSLDPHVADLIAAGEVVERPASVVKELVENAIDAGASAVVVELRRGGMGLIRVTDNGCGIAPEELPTAFLRHATSKLRTADDLSQIGTLGFRGEALAAISAVSRMEVLTCQPGGVGASLRLEGGVPGTVESVGAPEGTTMLVRDLFYNTPARLKFMRKDSAETAAVAGLLQHLSLSHPEVSFQFLKDGTESLHTPGDGRLESAIYAAQGREFARSLLPVEGRGGDITVSGFVTKPLQGRGSRNMQTFFVNGRYIKSQLLTAALEESYRNQMMKGKFPGCVLSVTLPVTQVDVNVHPAKTQVKFAKEQAVFDAVYHTLLDALNEQGGAVAAPADVPSVEKTQNPRADFYQTMDAKTYRERGKSAHSADAYRAKLEGRPVQQTETKKHPAWDSEWENRARVADSAPLQPFVYHTRPARPFPALGTPPASVRPAAADRVTTPPIERLYQPALPRKKSPAVPTDAVPSKQTAEPEQIVPAIPTEVPGQTALERPEEAPWRMVGEVLRTYIVCESGDGNVWLIDKHAAHERINFDRLKAAQTPVMRQTLLQPVTAEPGREDAELLLENRDLLEQQGFVCEDFGDGTILVREVPADIDAADTVPTLEELAQDLRTGHSLEEKRENLLHTMACKAAIKGGWNSDPKELQVLVERVQRGEVRFCPHGRPVAVKLSQYELEKMFKRA